MILNAYDTTAGRPLRINEHFVQTIKTLSLIGGLDAVEGHPDIKLITHENNHGIPTLSFPISYLSNERKQETVVDVRPFTNKKGVVINEPEYNCFIIAGILQNLMSKGELAVLRSSRNITTKAYARALAQRIGKNEGLDANEMTTLMVILGNFFILQLENETDNYEFISTNVIRQGLEIDPSISNNIIEDMGYIKDAAGLIKYINGRPDMYKLHGFGIKNFIGLGATIWFSSIGRQVMGAALEHVPLFTAICYAVVNNNMYKNTGIGLQLDPKYNKSLIESFNLTINNL